MIFAFIPVGFTATITPEDLKVTEEKGENDIIYTLSYSCTDAYYYEKARQETYSKLIARGLSDSEIEKSSYSVFLYPLELLVNAETGGKACTVKTFSLDGEKITLSLFDDILPAVVKEADYSGLYDGFSFTFTLSLVLNMNGVYGTSAGFGSVSSQSFSVPATSYIEYDTPEGTSLNSNPVFYFYPVQNDIILDLPERTGYTFTGFTDENGKAVGKVSKEARYTKLTLGWKVKSFQLRFVLTTRSGYDFIRCKTNNPSSFTCDTDVLLKDATAPSGWVFAGWYYESDFSGEAVTEIKKGTVKDIVLYAKWLTEDEYTEKRISDGKWGDINSDGKITSADARIALRSSVGLEKLSEDIIKRADFMKNGIISSSTARILLRVAVGLDTMKDILTQYGLL